MSVEIKNLADYGMKGLAWGAGFSTVILLSSLLIQTMQPGPSIQLVENKKQETKTVCTEKDIDWQPAYPKGQWQKLDRLPETGIEEYNNYSALDGVNVWTTINVEEANITPPEKMTYKAVTQCLEWRKMPKYSKVQVSN